MYKYNIPRLYEWLFVRLCNMFMHESYILNKIVLSIPIKLCMSRGIDSAFILR